MPSSPQLSRRISFVFLLACLCLDGCQMHAIAQQNAAFQLHSGDRVVFYGDSITAQRLYTADVEEFMITRYPGMDVEFFNAGVPGDTVYGGYAGDTTKRLQRDVFPHKPTMVTIMLGMNDPGYVPFDAHIFDIYKAGYKSLVDQINAGQPGVRLTLIVPTPYDEATHGTEFPGLGETVQQYGGHVADYGRQASYPVADFYAPMMSLLRKTKQDNPSFASIIIPDRIHPGDMAHWVMAETLMRRWGATSVVSRVRLDANKAFATLTDNADVSAVKQSATGLRWTCLERALPLPIPANEPMAQFIFREADLGSMDEEMLTVLGLPAEHYELQIDGKVIATLSRADLEKGVNLAALPTPMLGQARGVAWLEERRMKQDAARFSLIAEDPHVLGAAEAAATLEAASAATLKQQRTEAVPKPHQFELVAR
jgi:lysophospholipase L1-like esterase